MAAGAGLRRGVAYPVQQTALHKQPVVALLDQPVRGAPRLLHQRAAREMRGELIQFVVQHALRVAPALIGPEERSEEHTSELQSLMRSSYDVFCLKKKKKQNIRNKQKNIQLQ